MTRSVVSPRVSYSGSGSSGPFSVPFYFRDNDHVIVTQTDSEGESTVLTEGTHYTLTGEGTSTGSVTTTDTVDTGETLVIHRTSPLEQTSSILSGGDFSSTTVMRMVDVLTDIVQEIDTRLDMFLLPIGGYSPTHADNVGKYLKINSTGTEIETAEGVDVSAFIPGKNCLVVSTSNITLSGTQTIDGVGVVATNVVLVAGQTDKSENGPYVVAAGAWTRHEDHDDTDGLQAMTAFGITSGTTYQGTIWVCLTLDPVVDTDNIYIEQLASDVGAANVNINNAGTINFNSGDVVLTHSANALAMTGGQLTITYNGAATSEPLRLVNSTDNASVQVVQLEGDRATMTANDEAYASLLLSDSGGTQTEFARLTWKGTTVTDASEAGRLQFGVMTAGSLADELYLTGAALTPAANDGLALGTTALGFADLHLATGGVINFANGEITLTETANALTMAGGQLVVAYNGAAATAPVRVLNTTDAADNVALNIESDRATPANNDQVLLNFVVSDSAGNQDTFGHIATMATDVASGSEDGTMLFGVITAGTLANEIQLTGTALSPFADGGVALGTTALGFNGLHLNTGTAINWENSDVTITHSANALAFAGATSGYSFDDDLLLPSAGVISFNSGDVTITHSANTLAFAGATTGYSFDDDLLLASGSRINFNSGDVTVTHSANTLTFAGASSGFWFNNEITFGISGGIINFDSGGVLAFGQDSTAIGLFIHQYSGDDPILSLKSSDIAHGVTGTAPTDTFGVFEKASDTAGGLKITGISENATVTAMQFAGVGDTDATKSTAGLGVFSFDAYENDGTATAAAMTADSNLLVIRSGTTTRFIFDTEGTFHADVGSTTYDHLDDLATLNALDYHRAAPDDPIKQKFQEWMVEKRETLEKHKLIKFNEDGHHFVAVTRLAMLHTGAIRQLGEKLAERETQIAALERRLQAIEKKSDA